MLVDDLIVEVRDVNLARVGQLRTEDLEGLAVVVRVNDVGSWSVNLPDRVIDETTGESVEHALAANLRTAGAGLIVTGPNGVILSGPMTEATFEATSSDDVGVWTVTGVSDAILLADALAYPSPGIADPSAQTQPNDVRTGSAESLIRQYVAFNITNGALMPGTPVWAPAGRLVGLRTRLALRGTSLNRGVVQTRSPRFDNLLELSQSIAATSDLVFDVVQTGDRLEFVVGVSTDRSGFVRMDVENEQLDAVGFGYGSPTATRPIVAGQGEGTSRTILERTSADAATAESVWGRRIERFIDQRQTDVTEELEQAGDDLLAAEGSAVTSTHATPSADLALDYLVEWKGGDLVTVVVGGVEAKAKVTEVVLAVGGGVRVGATLGDPVGFDPEDVAYARATSTESRVSALERNIALPTDYSLRKATIDPYYTAGLPRVKYDGDSALTPGGIPWLYPYSPFPGDRVCVGVTRDGAPLIQGMLVDSVSKPIQLPLTLLNGWSDYEAINWHAGTMTKTTEGVVVLAGLIKGSTAASAASGTVIFNLPDGFRPDYDLIVPINQSDTNKQMLIRKNGNVEVWAGPYTTGGYVSLAGIAFPAAGVASWKRFGVDAGFTFANGWTNYTEGALDLGPLRMWLEPQSGMVYVQGTVAGGTAANGTAMTGPVPAEYRAASEEIVYTVGSGNALGSFRVNSATGSPAPLVNRLSYSFGGNVRLPIFTNYRPATTTSSMAWVNATYQSSWGHYGGHYATHQYAKSPGGIVYLRGLVGGGVVPAATTTLPTGSRVAGPSYGLLFPIIAADARGRIDLNTSGGTVVQTGSASWSSFSGLCFVAEQ